jgi:hypothetical protein
LGHRIVIWSAHGGHWEVGLQHTNVRRDRNIQ